MNDTNISVVVYKRQDAPCVQCNGVVRKLAKDAISFELVEYEAGSDTQRFLTDELGLASAPAVVVYDNGTVVTEHTFGGFRPERLAAIGSFIHSAASPDECLAS
jgi:glutaredoxin